VIGILAIERSSLLKGICSELRLQRFERQRLAGSLNVQIEISPYSPPERLKRALRSAVGKKAIVNTQYLPAANFVTIPFLPLLASRRK
jgi:hypothetical protein